MVQLVKDLPAMQRPGFNPWIGKIPWKREQTPTPVSWPGEFLMDCIVHEVAKSQTQLSDIHFTSVITEIKIYQESPHLFYM